MRLAHAAILVAAGCVLLSMEAAAEAVWLSPGTTYFLDASGRLGLEDVAAPEFADRFRPPKKEWANFGFTDAAVWLRREIEFGGERPADRFILVRSARIEQIDWYLLRRDGSVERGRGKMSGEWSGNAVRCRYPAFRLELEPGERATLFARLESRTSLNVSLWSYSPEAFADFLVGDESMYVFLLGCLAVLFVLAIMFAWGTRAPGYLIYAFSVGSIWLLFFQQSGHWSLWQWPLREWIGVRGNALLIQLSIMSLLGYTRDFFELRRQTPRFDRALRGCLAAGIGVLALTQVLPYRVVIQVLYFECLTIGLLIMATAAHFSWRGMKTARFYLVAWGQFWVLLMLQIATQFGWLPVVVQPPNMAFVGLVLGYTLFFIAMADRVRQIRIEKEAAQETALAIQRDMAVQLERQVAERTESLRQAKEEAEEANRSKSVFLANVSHDIRAPLSALVGLSQAMWMQSERRGLPEDFARFLHQIRAGGQYLNMILTNLLDVSAQEAGRARANPQPMDAGEWMRSMRDVLEPIAGVRGVRLAWEARGLPEVPVRADPIRLSQIAINLVHNAIKFTREKGAVWVALEGEPDGLRMRIEDEGPGLRDDEQENLFQLFMQGRGIQTGPIQGVGLGLYVVKANVEMLGGSLRAANRPEGGARFVVVIPWGVA